MVSPDTIHLRILLFPCWCAVGYYDVVVAVSLKQALALICVVIQPYDRGINGLGSNHIDYMALMNCVSGVKALNCALFSIFASWLPR